MAAASACALSDPAGAVHKSGQCHALQVVTAHMTSSSSLPGRGGVQWGPSCSAAHQSWPALWASWSCGMPRQAQHPQSWRCTTATAPRTLLRCGNVPRTPIQSQREGERDHVARVDLSCCSCWLANSAPFLISIMHQQCSLPVQHAYSIHTCILMRACEVPAEL